MSGELADIGRGGADDEFAGAGGCEVTKTTRYGTAPNERAHPIRSDETVVGAALVAVIGAWTVSLPLAGLAAGTVAFRMRSVAVFVVLLSLAVGASTRAADERADLQPDELGHFAGWVRIVDDPQPYASSTRVIAEVAGERFEIWSRGRAQQIRVRSWRGGEWVVMSGTRVALKPQRAGRVAWQHVVGEFTIDWASDVAPGGAVARASNRVRGAIERAATALPEPDGALFRGLVVGDDRDQPRAMIERFRASGLSHLTAVSGQNVAFVLAACGPLLRRLRPWTRLGVTVGLILWFVTLTRFEPSIVRAGAMASLSAFAYATGRERAPMRILSIAVAGLMFIDPLLVESIGFWLSVSATAGVSVIGPWIAGRLARFGFLAIPLGVTLGAQIGVALPSVLVFGRLPLVSIPANLLAVPVAGAVMLYGLPAGLVAGWLPTTAPLLMAPIRFGTRWVDTVALLGVRLEPPSPWSWIGWAVITMALAAVLVRGLFGRVSPADDDGVGADHTVK